MADYTKLYPTEASMRAATQGIVIDNSAEVASALLALNTPGALRNQAERDAVKQYAESMGAATNTTIKPQGTDSIRPPGMSDADWETIRGYVENPTGSVSTPEQNAVIGGGSGDGPLEWIKKRLTDVPIVILGLMVLGVALVATTKGQAVVASAVKK